MEKIYKTILLLAALSITTMLNGCSGDDNESFNEDSFRSYYFELTLTDTGADQADILLTTIEYIDYKGNKVTDTFSDQGDGTYSIVSHEYTAVPATGTISVTQTLRSGLTYDKESYVLGQIISLGITSTNNRGTIISRRTTEVESSQTIRASNLGKVYPTTTTFSYTVTKEGTISIR